MAIKLYYFPLPGRGEASRLMLTGGNVPFEDVRLTGGDWMALKPKTPFGQMPVLEVDGMMIAQSKAIDVYCAKRAGFYPEDPLDAAVADMVINQFEDTWMTFMPTFKITDAEARAQARQELLAGAVKEKLTALDKLLDGKEFVAGNKLSYGDVVLFVSLSSLISGMVDGVPADMLNAYPNLKRLRSKIAGVDFIKAYYVNETEAPRAAFKPDA